MLNRKPLPGERIRFTAQDMYPFCSDEPYIVLGKRHPEAYYNNSIIGIKQKECKPTCVIYKFVEGYNKSWEFCI